MYILTARNYIKKTCISLLLRYCTKKMFSVTQGQRVRSVVKIVFSFGYKSHFVVKYWNKSNLFLKIKNFYNKLPQVGEKSVSHFTRKLKDKMSGGGGDM